MGNILDALNELENASRVEAAWEFVRITTNSHEIVSDILENNNKTTLFDKEQLDFVKKLMRVQALDTAVHCAFFFKKTLSAPDTETRVHELCWTDLSKQCKEFMLKLDPHITLEENYNKIWKK